MNNHPNTQNTGFLLQIPDHNLPSELWHYSCTCTVVCQHREATNTHLSVRMNVITGNTSHSQIYCYIITCLESPSFVMKHSATSIKFSAAPQTTRQPINQTEQWVGSPSWGAPRTCNTVTEYMTMALGGPRSGGPLVFFFFFANFLACSC